MIITSIHLLHYLKLVPFTIFKVYYLIQKYNWNNLPLKSKIYLSPYFINTINVIYCEIFNNNEYLFYIQRYNDFLEYHQVFLNWFLNVIKEFINGEPNLKKVNQFVNISNELHKLLLFLLISIKCIIQNLKLLKEILMLQCIY